MSKQWDIGNEVALDDFGEFAYALQVCETWIREGGGEGDYNWRGEMRIEAMTQHEPT